MNQGLSKVRALRRQSSLAAHERGAAGTALAAGRPASTHADGGGLEAGERGGLGGSENGDVTGDVVPSVALPDHDHGRRGGLERDLGLGQGGRSRHLGLDLILAATVTTPIGGVLTTGVHHRPLERRTEGFLTAGNRQQGVRHPRRVESGLGERHSVPLGERGDFFSEQSPATRSVRVSMAGKFLRRARGGGVGLADFDLDCITSQVDSNCAAKFRKGKNAQLRLSAARHKVLKTTQKVN